MAGDGAEGRSPRVLVTGGAGFIGSHLCERLLGEGYRVVCMDNLRTGSLENIARFREHPQFEYKDHDVTTYIHLPGELDEIYHFASPASPVDFERIPIPILKVGALGTYNALGLARARGARLMLASTSEVYGDPLVHPQPESYQGNVNPIGIRGVYDEAKRYAESITMAYRRHHGVDTRIVRIFNSIMADETVVLFNDATAHIEPIEEYVDSQVEDPLAVPRRIYVPAFDPSTFRVEVRLANALIKHPSQGDAFEINTRYGRRIRVTGDHSVFRRSESGEPEAVPVRKLEVGDHIAIPARLPVVESDVPEINVAEHLIRNCSSEGDLWRYALVSSELASVIERHKEFIFDALSTSGRYEGSERKRNTVGCSWRRFRRDGVMPLAVAAALWRRGLMEWPPDARVRPFKGGGGVAVPNRIPVTKDLLWLAGLYLAEGNHVATERGDHRICISSDTVFVERAAEVIRARFGLRARTLPAGSGRNSSLYVDSMLLVYVFEKILEVTGTSRTARVPAWILQLPLSRVKHFLEGYREGDGSHTNYPERGKLEFSTTSERLATDLSYLLLRFGVLASIGNYTTTFKERYGDREFPFWRITVCGLSDFDILNWDAGVTQRLNASRLGDLVWAAVRDITPIEATPYVYDFSVEGYENFVAGNGIFAHNTYGPYMRGDDGRMIPNFVSQALSGEPLTVYGDGRQTRSVQYVDDLVEGIRRLMRSGEWRPVNIGNPVEYSVREVAELVLELSGSQSPLVRKPLPADDPKQRCPDISRAREVLGWEPLVPAREGLQRTVEWFSRGARSSAPGR